MRRFGVVRHIADLFDRYGVHRPDMVQSLGRRGGRRRRRGPSWQPELWRRLRARIGAPSPAERLAPACERIRGEPALLDLPARLSLFGLTRIPRSYLDVLAAIADQREVHLFVLHPSPSLWQRVGAELRSGPPITDRREDRTAAAAGQPAARLLGPGRPRAPARARGRRRGRRPPPRAGADVEPRTLLARIQADIREDRQPPGPPLPRRARSRARPRPGGPKRPDPRLPRPRAPGRGAPRRGAASARGRPDARAARRDRDVPGHRDVRAADPGHVRRRARRRRGRRRGRAGPNDSKRLPDLRVRLADRSLRQTNPVLGVVSQLLALADQRATASQLLDLAGARAGPPAVRLRRRRPVADAGLGRRRAGSAGASTPRTASRSSSARSAPTRGGAGLDRILVGVAMTEEDRRLVEGVLPLDDVESGAIDLAGRFAEFVDRVQAAVDALTEPKPIARGPTRSPSAADALTATSERDSWQRRELQRLLDDVDAESGGGPRPAHRERRSELELADVRALLADRLRGRPTRANFRTGHLTVCTLVPMRSVPHRVVCILGLDDGEFPRRARRDGDDLMLADPHVGDRDPRTEDRQMLLDALMAATERLIITYTGNDERTNLRRPPAVPVGELLDIVDRTVRCDTASRARSGRDPPSAPAVRPAELHRREARARQAVGLRPAGARAARGRSSGRARPRRAFLPAPLPPRPRPHRSSSTTSCGSSSSPSARSCATGSGSASASSSTRSRTRCRSSSTRSRSGASGSGCSRACSPAPSSTPA